MTLFTSCFLHTGILIYQELFRIQTQFFFFFFLPARGHKNGPTTRCQRGKLFFYLAAFRLNTKKNRLRCSLLHECKTDARVMHGRSLLSGLSVSGFITRKKEIVTAEVNPQKISPYIKSTIRSYLSCFLANWKRALFTLFHTRDPGHPPVTPI